MSQIFDLLDLLAPVIIVAKLLIQRLWQINVTWHESVPNEIEQNWLQFRNQLTDLVEFDMHRHVTHSHAVFFTHLRMLPRKPLVLEFT